MGDRLLSLKDHCVDSAEAVLPVILGAVVKRCEHERACGRELIATQVSGMRYAHQDHPFQR